MPGPDTDQLSYDDLIDSKVLNKLKTLRDVQAPDEPDIVTNLVDMFLSHVPDRTNALRAALSQQDMLLVERLAHTLRSSCASIGAHSMASLCGVLENQAAQGLQEGAQELLDRLENHFHQVSPYLAAERIE